MFMFRTTKEYGDIFDFCEKNGKVRMSAKIEIWGDCIVMHVIHLDEHFSHASLTPNVRQIKYFVAKNGVNVQSIGTSHIYGDNVSISSNPVDNANFGIGRYDSRDDAIKYLTKIKSGLSMWAEEYDWGNS